MDQARHASTSDAGTRAPRGCRAVARHGVEGKGGAIDRGIRDPTGAARVTTLFEVLCEDGPVLAVNKPAGLLTLGATTGVPTLERQVKAWLKERFQKSGNVYLGIPHRLDRPVSGVVVFARNSKAAARLAEQFRERQVRKVYWAVVERPPEPLEGEWVDWLAKIPDQARVLVVPESTPGARQARLRYRTLRCDLEWSDPAETSRRGALVEVELITGRMHQIRVQFASRGCPVMGDTEYGALSLIGDAPHPEPRERPIALHARSMTLLHPVRYEPLTVTAPFPEYWSRWIRDPP
jgi:23S rRNA pseudouridine1911/1915/1917 synthase